MKFKDLKKSLLEKIDFCYILSNGNDKEDLFLKSSCKNNIIAKSIEDFADLNLSIFTNENLDAVGLQKSLTTLPFMAKKRVVIIKESEGRKNDDVKKVIDEYLINPLETTVLIIDECENSSYKSLEKKDNVTLVDCSRLDVEILTSFILKETKKFGIEIDKKAINKLIDVCDGYMSKIDLEINKLINMKFNEKVVTTKDIEECVNVSDEYQIFELTNALIDKNGDRALYICEDIIKNKKNVSMILNLIYNHIRKLFYVKVTKTSTAELSQLLDVKEYAIKKYMLQVEKISAKKLKEILILCKDIDYNVKSGNLDLISGIYNLVFTILI